MYIFKIWFNRSEKSSIIDVRLGSKYASVNITLHLTFFKKKKTVYRKLMKFFVGFKQFRVDVHFANFGQVETDPICSFFTDFGEVTVILLSWVRHTTFQQTFVYILCTKFSWHSFFFILYTKCSYAKVCQNAVYILYTFCIHIVYISCIPLAQFLYTKRIHSFHVGNQQKDIFSIKKYLPIQSMISSPSKKSKPL